MVLTRPRARVIQSSTPATTYDVAAGGRLLDAPRRARSPRRSRSRRSGRLFAKEVRMAKALVLTAITGARAGERHVLASRVATVGSASSNDLVLRDRLIEPR